ncbi:hypothetical protein D920_00003 [Enterococcus faecalis 13-SD-W-01]|nr:hypothetical protein D920_00003 [Enterococcus faecalis 13-SD-W-01]
MAVKQAKRQARELTSVCSLTEIESRAQSIRLFDRSIWINLGDGRIFNPKTRKMEPLSQKYDEIRTATLPGKIVFAKRPRPVEPLYLVKFPYKVRS